MTANLHHINSNHYTVAQPAKPVVYVLSCDDEVLIGDPTNDRVLKLNSTALEMWKLLSTGQTELQVIHTMAQTYCVEEARLQADLRVLLSKLAEHALSINSSFVIASGEQTTPLKLAQCSLTACPQNSRNSQDPRNSFLIQAFLGLCIFDMVLWFRGLHHLLSTVHSWPTAKRKIPKNKIIITEICSSIEQASVWYPKRALCLQRSAVTTCLLRSNGIAAQMVIGAHPLPFSAHAWVEANDEVVNESPAIRHFFQSLASY